MKKVSTQNELYEIIIQKIDGLENRFDTLEEKVDQLGEKVDVLDERVGQMSGRLYFVEKTTLAIRDDIKGMTSVLQNHDVRIGQLELA